MLEIKVGRNNSDFRTITEAVQAVPYEESAVVYIEAGTYEEKIFCEKKDITFLGEGIGRTVLQFSDKAAEVMPDGSKRGTFRSYTAFFGGEKVTVKNMSIRNNAGDGRIAGQALAVYADASKCYFENVELFGHQDTLFMSPLPVTERQKNGFLGPRVMTDRRLTKQYYKDCRIYGDVDFIFGGADVVFDNCSIICNNRRAVDTSADVLGDQKDMKAQSGNERFINGYVTAGCGISSNIGMIFRKCDVRGEAGCDKESVFLGRPWRDEAKAVFLDCTMDETIAPERFSGWGAVDKPQPGTYYGEYGTRDDKGALTDLSKKNSWVKDVDADEADKISSLADEIINEVMKKI